jgi:phytoene synthase
MGCADDVAWARAADLGVAMQLTNIARDVGEDARRGRVYLPATLCDEVGLDRRALVSATQAGAPVREAVRRLLARAEAHYRAADLGVPLLPRACRPAIRASRLIYAAIGGAIAVNGYDTITRRAFVPLGQKLWLAARAQLAWFRAAGARSLTSTGPADAELAPLLAEVGLPVPRRLP